MEDTSERSYGPRRRRWPVVAAAVFGAFVLTCIGIVVWSLIDTAEPDVPAADAPVATPVETTEPGLEVGDGDIEVGVSRRLFTRRLDGDVEVRVSATDNMTAEQAAGLKPNDRPLWCENLGWMEGQVITPDSILFASVSRQVQNPPGGMYQVSTQPAGDDLVVAIAVAVPDGVSRVRVAVPGGGVDEMEPVDGLALLVVTVADGAAAINGGVAPGGLVTIAPAAGFGESRTEIAVPIAPGVRPAVQMVLDDGSVVDIPAPGSAARSWMFPEEAPQCQQQQPGGPVIEPPPVVVTLPPPGDQPADPEAAEAEIRENHASLYSFTPDQDLERLALIDDPTGVLDALEAVRAPGSIMETVDGAIEVEITDLVFTSPTEAQFFYDLNAGQFSFPDNRGRARLIDGVWKITRGTYCQDLGRASVGCGP